ncbi:hypothetical protein BDV27DRAFT_150936 [Aspergillus caelatus]|uniref:Uncharacterized protein n=1 Tax=Aspergillus caelatus TaxID=61420 RepID=A0A5N6ZKJ2_9EURO|nr:uncharacterized protein BDV27DRAFT_150936 [Aspergillus caelatus]KAE8357898.1 hypothetical protein BDV27DRAFT_150936 [Aspergillus caelatus]
MGAVQPTTRVVDFVFFCVLMEGVQREIDLCGSPARSACQSLEYGANLGRDAQSVWAMSADRSSGSVGSLTGGDQGRHEPTQYQGKIHGANGVLRYPLARKNAVAATVLDDRVCPLWVGDDVVVHGISPSPCRGAILEICAFPDLVGL